MSRPPLSWNVHIDDGPREGVEVAHAVPGIGPAGGKMTRRGANMITQCRHTKCRHTKCPSRSRHTLHPSPHPYLHTKAPGGPGQSASPLDVVQAWYSPRVFSVALSSLNAGASAAKHCVCSTPLNSCTRDQHRTIPRLQVMIHVRTSQNGTVGHTVQGHRDRETGRKQGKHRANTG